MIKRIMFLIILIIGGCSSQPSNNESEAGNYLYKNKCGGCHRIYNKEEFTPVQWKSTIGKMKTKAKLTEAEEKIILEYLTK